MQFTIRNATLSDIKLIENIEKNCFPDHPCPTFVFVQLFEIASEGFFVAQNDSGDIVGYIVGAQNASEHDSAWILGMGVLSQCRGCGIAKKLLSKFIDAVEKSWKTQNIFLSVQCTNIIAINLYQGLLFKIINQTENYFFDNEKRYIMVKKCFHKDESIKCNRVEGLIGEAGTSVQFATGLFTVCAAVLTILCTDRENLIRMPYAFYYFCMATFSSFYSLIFYSNASGTAARNKDYTKTNVPLRYGNAISEYFGVFQVIMAFPLVVWGISQSELFSLIAISVDIITFLFYQFSGYDLMSRVVTNKYYSGLISIALALVIFTQFYSVISSNNFLSSACTVIFTISCATLVFFGTSKGEVCA